MIPLHRGIAPIRPPVDYDTRPRSADTPLVAFFRRHQETIGLVCLAVATVAGCLFAFQVGRGAL